jgi:hypothetical protein
MNALLRPLFVLVAISSGLPALAAGSEQAAAEPAAAAAEEVPAAAAAAANPASPAAPAAQASKPADASKAEPSEGQAPAVAPVPPGYKAKEIGGEKMYCRKSTPLGSRFPTEVCMTVAQYEESVRQGDGLRQELTGKQKSYSISQ